MKKSSKLILIISILGFLVSFLALGFYYLLPKLILRDISSAHNSIGIIGGADGPTTILISPSSTLPIIIFVVLGICSIIGIVYVVLTRKKSH